MIAVLLACALALFAVPAAAEESTPPAPTSAAPRSADDLVSSSLGQDIATASYYELEAWCHELGIDESGSRRELQDRLAKHFKVTLPAAAPAVRRTITVRSARESEYYTVPDVNEKYVRLRGDVALEVKDQTDGTLQVITASSVTYNQTRRTVSAEGDVAYSLTRGGKTDTFKGQSLAFDLDSSEAVFYDGSTTRTVSQGGTEIHQTFRGETITRMANDTVILQNGSFTSSDMPVDPLYQIKAKQVWILAPGEWAIQNAVLMIGRVPMPLYIPGFFWPGDDFIFNPTFGYKSREGAYVQTTTYLLGRRPKQDNPFTFLQLTESGDTGYDLEPHGLFLRKVPTNTAAQQSKSTVKLMLDVYSRLGILGGVAGDFSPLATFRTSIGVSRSLFQPVAGFFTPFLPEAVTGYSIGQQFWNSSSLLGLGVPFRYGLEGTFQSSGDIYSVTAGFQYFSDPYFTTDFYSRSEAGLLSTVLSKVSTGTIATQQANSAVQQSNLSWDFAGKLDFTKMIGLPFVQTFSMPNLGLKATWQSYTPPSLSDPQNSDPGRTYYYLSSITAPNVSFTLAGDILKLTSTPKLTVQSQGGIAIGPGGVAGVGGAGGEAARESRDPGKGIRMPMEVRQNSTRGTEKSARVLFRGPVPQKDVATGEHAPESSLTVSYQVQPRATLEHTFDTNASQMAGHADYGIRYQTFDTGGTSSVTASTSLLDRLANLSESLSVDGLWRSRFNPSTTEAALPDWQSLLQSDLQQNRLALRNAVQASVQPFLAIPQLSGSSLQYKLGVRLYQVSAAIPDPSDPVSEHSLQSSIIFNTPSTTDSLVLAMQLPPLALRSYTGALSLSAGVLKGKLQGGITQSDTAVPPIQYQPIVASATIDAGNKINTTEEVQAARQSTGDWILDKSTSSLQLGGFSGAFVAQWMYPLDGLGVQQSPQQSFLPSTMKIGYETGGDPMWFWKDRIKLDLSIKSHWYLNLQKYTDNLFDFSLNLTLSIYKFLDLTISSVSTNTKTYRYIRGWAAAVGEVLPADRLNPLTDFLQSFDFFDSNNRIQSAFKIGAVAVKAVNHLHDWDLTLQYQGSPQMITTSGAPHYEWIPTFAIQVQWNAVPQMKSDVHGDSSTISLR